jgi:hypothetical protein
VLRVLEARFPGAVPEDVATAIGEVNDASELDRLLDAAISAITIQAFRAELER